MPQGLDQHSELDLRLTIEQENLMVQYAARQVLQALAAKRSRQNHDFQLAVAAEIWLKREGFENGN